MRNQDVRYVAEGRKNRQANWKCSIRQWASLGFVAMAVAGSAGCNTFIQQTTDLVEGGPQRRVEEATRRQQAAIETQRRLKQDQRELEQLLAAEERRVREMRGRLQMQAARISKARESNRITAAQEQNLKHRVAELDSEIQSLELKIAASKVSAESAEQANKLRVRLEALKAEEQRIEQEIQVLEK